MALGLVIAGAVTVAFAATLHYVAPAENATPTAAAFKPIVEFGWIKMPFDINRDKECLANSTITLRRKHDYGPGLGVRTDVVVIGLFNTTITDVGLERVMLWFRQPENLTAGEWAYDSKVQDDCGGVGDWLNFSTHHPRVTTVPGVLIIAEPRP